MTDDNTLDPDGSTSGPDSGRRDLRLVARLTEQATRPIVGWALVVIGAIAILVGYLGVSREVLVAKQIPYLVSGGIGGMVLVAVGAFLLGTDDLRGELARLNRIERQLDDLHRVLLVPVDEEAQQDRAEAGADDDRPATAPARPSPPDREPDDASPASPAADDPWAEPAQATGAAARRGNGGRIRRNLRRTPLTSPLPSDAGTD